MLDPFLKDLLNVNGSENFEGPRKFAKLQIFKIRPHFLGNYVRQVVVKRSLKMVLIF